MSTAPAASNKIRIENVRLSFPDLFEATQFEGQGPFKFGATFLVAPGSKADKAIRAKIDEVAQSKWAAKAPAIVKAQYAKDNSQSFCYTTGDQKAYDGYEGMMVLRATRDLDKGRPGVYDLDRSPLQPEDGKPYAGCYVNASVEFWAQDNKYGKSVRCTLVGVQFAADGDAFSAGSKASEDDFDDLGEGAEAEELA